jgi:lipopolysaccharide export system protein LptC
MRIDDITYSWLIGVLKIALPLLALAILSTLFLVARGVDPAQDLPYANVEVDELVREERIGRPSFSAVTSEGASIALSAEQAAPDPDKDGQVNGREVRATIDLPSGEAIWIEAEALELDQDADHARLLRDVRVSTDSGYELESGSLEIALDDARLMSDVRTTVRAAIGAVSADRFELSRPDPDTGNYLLVFNGNVQMVYDPGS